MIDLNPTVSEMHFGRFDFPPEFTLAHTRKWQLGINSWTFQMLQHWYLNGIHYVSTVLECGHKGMFLDVANTQILVTISTSLPRPDTFSRIFKHALTCWWFLIALTSPANALKCKFNLLADATVIVESSRFSKVISRIRYCASKTKILTPCNVNQRMMFVHFLERAMLS